MVSERPDILSPLLEGDLYDPLSDVTRAERRLLLLVSLITLALTWADLLPTRIDALGIELTQPNRLNLILLVAATLLYFLIAFSVYASADFSRWRVARSVAHRKSSDPLTPLLTEVSTPSELPLERLSALSSIMSDAKLGTSARRVSVVRAAFEFLVPIAVALLALLSVTAELIDLPSPFALLVLAWQSSPTAVAIAGALAAAIAFRWWRKRRRPYRRSWVLRRFGWGLRLMKLATWFRDGSRIRRWLTALAEHFFPSKT